MKKAIWTILAFIVATTAWAGYETGAAYQVLRVPSGGGRPVYGAVDLSQSAATTNQLPASRGGTGQDFSASTGFLYDTSGTVAAKTVTQATALLDAVVGDSGSGGTKGLVPAPSAGDAAAGKFLKADGTFALPSAAVGQVIMTAATSCPTNSVAANGASLLRAGTYASLFTAISTTYGTADGTHFTVPDMRGVFPRGAGSQTISSITHTGTQGTTEGDAFQGHYHTLTNSNGSRYRVLDVVSSGGVTGTTSTFTTADPVSVLTVTTPITDGSDGTPRTGAETRPANISLLYCIYYQ